MLAPSHKCAQHGGASWPSHQSCIAGPCGPVSVRQRLLTLIARWDRHMKASQFRQTPGRYILPAACGAARFRSSGALHSCCDSCHCGLLHMEVGVSTTLTDRWHCGREERNTPRYDLEHEQEVLGCTASELRDATRTLDGREVVVVHCKSTCSCVLCVNSAQVQLPLGCNRRP